MIDLQDIITTKRELLSREPYSRNPINYSAGMAEDQKDRYIQYLAEQNQDLRLTGDAMKLVLEDFKKNLIMPIRNVLVIDVKRSNLKLRRVIQTAGRRRMIMMEPMIRFVRIQLVMLHLKR